MRYGIQLICLFRVQRGNFSMSSDLKRCYAALFDNKYRGHCRFDSIS